MIGIIAIIYNEPEWVATKRFIKSLDLPTIYVDRDGVGSMSKAYNTGFKHLTAEYDLEYVWMISNVIPYPDTLDILLSGMEGYDALSPSFQSDHEWTRPQFFNGTKEVPFIEFTAPLVRVSTFKEIQLDEGMPYWGHDLSWGYEVRQVGGKVGVHYGTQVRHEYIRHKARRKPLKVTRDRLALRKATDESTCDRLEELYGYDWGKVLGSKIH